MLRHRLEPALTEGNYQQPRITVNRQMRPILEPPGFADHPRYMSLRKKRFLHHRSDPSQRWGKDGADAPPPPTPLSTPIFMDLLPEGRKLLLPPLDPPSVASYVRQHGQTAYTVRIPVMILPACEGHQGEGSYEPLARGATTAAATGYGGGRSIDGQRGDVARGGTGAEPLTTVSE
jgi:hypothetical protein